MMRCRTLSLLLIGGAILLPRPALATQFDRLFFSVDTFAHIPKTLAADATASGALELAELRPVAQDVSLVYGVGTEALHGDVVMRLGYRFARGDFPTGSIVGNATVTRYALNGVPIFAGFQATILDTRVRPFFDVEAGGTYAEVTYDRDQIASLASGWSWCWGLKAGIGAHVDIWEWVAVRLSVGGEWSQELWLEHGPSMSMTTLGINLAVVARPPLRPTVASDAIDEKEPIRQYTPLTDGGRMADAFVAIRAGDDAMRRRDFIAAEASYRKGVQLIPHDTESRRNIEAPVRADWARALIEVGRAQEAVDVITEALRIDPQSSHAQAIVEELRRRGISVTKPAPGPAAPEPLY